MPEDRFDVGVVVKWIKGVEFVADVAEIGGGYNQDHEFFVVPPVD